MNFAEKVIQSLGGTSKVAALCNIRTASVSDWKSKGQIPAARLMFLKLLRPDVFEKIELQEKCPHCNSISGSNHQ